MSKEIFNHLKRLQTWKRKSSRFKVKKKETIDQRKTKIGIRHTSLLKGFYMTRQAAIAKDKIF